MLEKRSVNSLPFENPVRFFLVVYERINRRVGPDFREAFQNALRAAVLDQIIVNQSDFHRFLNPLPCPRGDARRAEGWE